MSTATVIYDTVFGNTARVSQAIAGRLNQLRMITELASMQQVDEASLSRFTLLVVGSPTRGYLPTPSIREFLAGLPSSPGRAAAVFDTRLELSSLPFARRWAVDVGGYAASRMAQQLSGRNYTVLAENCFFVEGYEGPLKSGELERAEQWATHLVERTQSFLAKPKKPVV